MDSIVADPIAIVVDVEAIAVDLIAAVVAGAREPNADVVVVACSALSGANPTAAVAYVEIVAVGLTEALVEASVEEVELVPVAVIVDLVIPNAPT